MVNTRSTVHLPPHLP